VLDFDDRHRRRMAMTGTRGLEFLLDLENAVALRGGARKPLSAFAGSTVHALAAIGNPQRFFKMLRGFGMTVIEHPLPDHAPLACADLMFSDGHPVLMTEKDAVKCGTWVDDRHWCVPVEARFADADARRLLETVVKCMDAGRRAQGNADPLPTRGKRHG